MFSRISRYRQLPNVVTVDARGRSAESKSLRLLPEVAGTFLHTVEETDRLDHLAYKYYRQPTQWWRICDANPEIESPRDLIGKGPIVTYRFPFGTGRADDRPPWSELLHDVGALVGVEEVTAVEQRAAPAVVGISAFRGTLYEERYERALVVRFNRLSVTLEEVSESVTEPMTKAGLASAQPVEIGRVGKTITIPPRPAGRGS